MTQVSIPLLAGTEFHRRREQANHDAFRLVIADTLGVAVEGPSPMMQEPEPAPALVAQVSRAEAVDDRDELQRSIDTWCTNAGVSAMTITLSGADAQNVAERLAPYRHMRVVIDETGQ